MENFNEIVITPFSKKKDSLTIFEPKSRSIAMEGTCQSGVTFKAVEGVLISGSSTPPVPEAQVVVQRQLPDGTLEHATSLVLDADGKFVVGPILKDVYQVILSKQDYIFVKSEGSDFDFIAKKVSRLDIVVKDKNGKLLESVFVSISAGKDI